VRIDHAAYERLEDNDAHGPDSDADERQTRHCNRPAPNAGEGDGIRHEAFITSICAIIGGDGGQSRPAA
jgi:hypothetical protein